MAANDEMRPRRETPRRGPQADVDGGLDAAEDAPSSDFDSQTVSGLDLTKLALP